MSLLGALRARCWRGPSQEVGDPCEDCGAVLVLCVQCGTRVRCSACYPYERSRDAGSAHQALLRVVREHPSLGLFAGALTALLPAALCWVGSLVVGPGLLRVLGSMAGAVACCAYLSSGAVLGSLPLRGEVPPCRMDDRTPYDRRALVGTVAFVVQVALVSIGVAAN